MTYQVRVKESSGNQKIKATVASGVIMARTLNELLDVDVSNVSDKYVIMYNASTQKYTACNPDDILAATVEDTVSPGIPSQFIGELDTDLTRDSNIDLDGGTW